MYSSKFFPIRCALSPLLLTMRQSISDDLSAFSYRNRGLAYAVLAEAFGTAMNAVVQLLEARYETPKAIHSLTILFLRMSLTAVFTSAGVWYRGVPDPFGPHGARLLLVLRSFAGLCGVLGMYWSLMYLDLGEATVISLLSPQMACLLSALWMKETINVSEQISLLISLGGVLLIIRPFGWDQTTETTSGEAHLRRSMAAEGAHGLVRLDLSLSLRLAGAMSALLGATGGAVAMLAIRQAGDRVHPLVSVNYYAWACTAVALMSIALSGDWTELLPEGTIAWVLIGSLSACGFLKVSYDRVETL